MKIGSKVIVYVYVVFLLVSALSSNYISILLFLIIGILDVLNTNYFDNVKLTFIRFVFTFFVAFYSPSFIFFIIDTVIDIYHSIKKREFFLLIGIGLFFLENINLVSTYIIISIFSIIIAVNLKIFTETNVKYTNLIESERNIRIRLEEAKERLERMNIEIAHMTEINERNRIAREIHDSVGHSIAAVLIQLQAAQMLLNKNQPKGNELLNNSIEKLSQSLNLLRDTVYNIKPKFEFNFNYINKTIESFKFCETTFTVKGDISKIKPFQIEVLALCIKEALINAYKYSGANLIEINLEGYNKFVRLMIKDNGKGCKKIKFGIGLSNMKDRIEKLGGNLSISSDDGFLIVVIIPFSIEGD